MRKVVLLLIILLTFISCQYLFSLKSNYNLTKKIEGKFNKTSEIIDLSELNDFEWDNLLIISPYYSIKSAEKELHLNLENIRENRIKYSDSINLLIFLKNGKSIQIAEVSRIIGDFENTLEIIKKGNTKFIKSKNGNNKLIKQK